MGAELYNLNLDLGWYTYEPGKLGSDPYASNEEKGIIHNIEAT